MEASQLSEVQRQGLRQAEVASLAWAVEDPASQALEVAEGHASSEAVVAPLAFAQTAAVAQGTVQEQVEDHQASSARDTAREEALEDLEPEEEPDRGR